MSEQGGTSAASPADDDRARVLEAIIADDAGWKVADSPIEFDDELRWRPDLVRNTSKNPNLLHVSTEGQLPGAYARRMKAAADAGYGLTFATSVGAIDIDVLLTLQSLDARIYRVDLDGDTSKLTKLRSVADLVATDRSFLDPDSLRALARPRLVEAQTSTSNAAKGRFFEEVLCLVFSQVDWLTVDHHAYNNETEEIDLVISCRAATGYVAGLVGGPIIIATAKNEQKATNSQTVKYLKEQMANRRGRCKLGFLCSASTISSEARGEILRGSQDGEAVIVCIDLEVLEGLIENADQLDERVEELIRKAIAD